LQLPTLFPIWFDPPPRAPFCPFPGQFFPSHLSKTPLTSFERGLTTLFWNLPTHPPSYPTTMYTLSLFSFYLFSSPLFWFYLTLLKLVPFLFQVLWPFFPFDTNDFLVFQTCFSTPRILVSFPFTHTSLCDFQPNVAGRCFEKGLAGGVSPTNTD